MIKDKELLTLITRRNVSYYKSIGYNVDKINTEVLIKIDDINHNSHQKIIAICDICGCETELRVHKYYENYDRYNYYGCKKCSREKSKKTNLERYGEEYYNNKEKTQKTCLEKYGVNTTLLDKKTKDKIKKTNLELYGCEQVLSSPIVREKFKDTFLNKYGVDHFSKSTNFQIVGYNNWKKQILEKLEKYNIQDFILKDDRTVDIKCDCGKDHYFNITSKNLYQRKEIQGNILCTECNKIDTQISGKELQILNFIKENYTGLIIENDKKILKGKELDIYLPELNLAVEFNGVYWHSELYKEKNYHKSKTEKCEELNIQLFHIWEDDWHHKKNIVESMILNKLNKTPNKIYARKCILKEISDNSLVLDFLEKNHIQGFVGSSIKIGLFYNDVLVSLMTFGKKRKILNSKSREGEYELLRFCNILNTNVVGGASKLFKHFVKTYAFSEIITYADRSHSKGILYNALGFGLISKTDVGYSYYDHRLNKYNRFNFRKDVLVKEGYDPTKTEVEIMYERGYFRVFNSGNLKYVYTSQ